MTVYVVRWDVEADVSIVSIHSTKDKAEESIDEKERHYQVVEEWEVQG